MELNIKQSLKNNSKLTKINKTIIKFIEVDPYSVLDLSIEKLAAQCYTTKSTVITTLKKIGISGYKELKRKIAKEMQTNDKNGTFTLSKETINNIKATELHLRSSKITDAAKNIINAKSVMIIGGGSISYIGAILSDQLNKINIRASWYEVQDPKIISDKSDTIIFLSNSGVNEYIYNKARFLKNRAKNNKVISITASNTTNIKEFCNFHIAGSRLFVISKKEYHLPTVSISIIWFIIQNLIKEIVDIEKKVHNNPLQNIKHL